MLSTRNLTDLPDIDALRQRMRALAVLDAMLSPDWDYRYFSFNDAWGDGEQLGSMRDGEGDDLFVWFGPGGCWIKGFAHEAAFSPFRQSPPGVVAGVLDGVPAAFAGCLREPAFNLDETTFCVWRTVDDTQWRHGPVAFPADESDPDGSADLLALLDGGPQTYADWAADYYERDVPLAAVEAVFAGKPVTAALAASFGCRMLRSLREDLEDIGYPFDGDAA